MSPPSRPLTVLEEAVRAVELVQGDSYNLGVVPPYSGRAGSKLRIISSFAGTHVTLAVTI